MVALLLPLTILGSRKADLRAGNTVYRAVLTEVALIVSPTKSFYAAGF